MSRTNYAELAYAYRCAQAITWEYSQSFFLASQLLPKAHRKAIRALYGFCRLTDNLADGPGSAHLSDLSWWRNKVNRPWQQQDVPVLAAWAHTREEYGVPQKFGDELIEGCEFDLNHTRYQTFEQLSHYCYCVASTVGLMAMHIVGLAREARFEQTYPYAVKLGVALQMTNILRDVGEDASRGRLYLPLEDLERFGVAENELLEGHLSKGVLALLQFEIARTEQLYAEAWPGIALLKSESRFAVGAAGELYRRILGRIAANKYDVFTRRAYVGLGAKLRALPAIWWHTARLSSR